MDIDIERVGRKETKWNNFMKTCNKLNRDAVHIQNFYLSEMSTTGFIESPPSQSISKPCNKIECRLLINRYIIDDIKEIRMEMGIIELILNFYYFVSNEQCLILKGRWKTKQIKCLLKKYIKEYVICDQCKSLNTSLSKLKYSKNGTIVIICMECQYQKITKKLKRAYVSICGGRFCDS